MLEQIEKPQVQPAAEPEVLAPAPRGASKRGKSPRHIPRGWLAGALIAAAVAIFCLCRLQSPAASTTQWRNIQPDWSYLTSDGALKSYSDPHKKITAQVGVDVSTHQGEIDWKAVRESGVDFAMVRLGYRGYESGKLALDANFQQNVAGAQAAGLEVGVYFFSQALTEQEAEAEADFVIEQLQGLSITYPVVYDQEEYTEVTARTDDLTGQQATQNALAFCQRIQEAGYQPMIYCNNYWASEVYDLTALDDYPIWYADYREEPTLEGGFSMWQYTNEGIVPGTESSYVDLNLRFLPEP